MSSVKTYNRRIGGTLIVSLPTNLVWFAILWFTYLETKSLRQYPRFHGNYNENKNHPTRDIQKSKVNWPTVFITVLAHLQYSARTLEQQTTQRPSAISEIWHPWKPGSLQVLSQVVSGGLIEGIHRLFLGGIICIPCSIATISARLLVGLIFNKIKVNC